ncbi:phosphotransferase [Uniformispora flossi]|uniref:phosphotransferase n=1 Tax=Uniformispora flossi TaxID=3390723 RepID=UPI003C2BC4DF
MSDRFAADGPSVLSPLDIDLVRHRLGMPTHGGAGTFPPGVGTSDAVAGFVGDAYANEGLSNFPLPGRPPVRGAFSTGVVAMTTQGFVVGQRTSDNYRTTRPTLMPEPVLTTPDALRIANAQRPRLTPRLLHNDGERLMVTSFEFGVHAANDDSPGSALMRQLLLRGLPDALAAFATIDIPPEARRHPRIDSGTEMIARARRVRADRYSEEQLHEAATFGIDDALYEALTAETAGFTPRAPGVVHNDLDYDNLLLRVAPRLGSAHSDVCLLDLQFVTIADPVLDVAVAAVKLDCTMQEVVDLTAGWAERLGPAHTAGVERDLPTGMAVVGATQAAVVVPSVIAEVRGAAEHDRAGLDRALDDGTARIHKVVAPALTYGRDLEVTPDWVRDRLAATVPRNPAMIAGSDLASARNAAPDLTRPSWSPGPATTARPSRGDTPTPAWIASTPPIDASRATPARAPKHGPGVTGGRPDGERSRSPRADVDPELGGGF